MKPLKLPCCTDEVIDPSVAIRIVFKPDNTITTRQEMELLKTIVDEVLAEIRAEEAANDAASEISSPS